MERPFDDQDGGREGTAVGIGTSWHTAQMATTPAIDVEGLSRDEQLELLDKLWDSLGRNPRALPLSDEQMSDLDRRLDELERDGTKGAMTWDEAIDQIRPK